MTTRLSLATMSPRDRRAVRLGAWVLLPTLLIVLVIRPWTTAFLERQTSLATQRALLAREVSLLADSSDTRQKLVVARRALDEVAPRLFSGTEAATASAELARYLALQTARSGLTVERTETETILDGASSGPSPINETRSEANDIGAPTLRVILRARGDVRAIVALLHALEQGPKLVRVERLAIGRAISGSEVDEDALTVTATISGLAASAFHSQSAAGDTTAHRATVGHTTAGGAP
jgi:hypothetical protein